MASSVPLGIADWASCSKKNKKGQNLIQTESTETHLSVFGLIRLKGSDSVFFSLKGDRILQVLCYRRVLLLIFFPSHLQIPRDVGTGKNARGSREEDGEHREERLSFAKVRPQVFSKYGYCWTCRVVKVREQIKKTKLKSYNPQSLCHVSLAIMIRCCWYCSLSNANC